MGTENAPSPESTITIDRDPRAPNDQAVREIQSASHIIGRGTELQAILLLTRLGRNSLLEGPVGTGKTLLALAVTRYLNQTIIRIDGDSRYTEQKLVGHWNPEKVLNHGFTQDAFEPGPLVEAMKLGKPLFINELNRMPESVQNVLLPALDEKTIEIPHYGQLKSAPGFLVIATQNPRDFVGTSNLSEALSDRFEWISIDYPDSVDEVAICLEKSSAITRSTATQSTNLELMTSTAVELIRLTRHHPQIRRGGSVRASQAVCEIAASLLAGQACDDSAIKEAVKAAAILALPTRVELSSANLSGDQFKKLWNQLLDQLIEPAFEQAKKNLIALTAGANDPGSNFLPRQTRELVIDTGIGPSLEDSHNSIEDFTRSTRIDEAQFASKQPWDFAVRYQDIIKYFPLTKTEREAIDAQALKGLLHTARRLVGPLATPTERQVKSHDAVLPGERILELDIESTLEDKATTLPSTSSVHPTPSGSHFLVESALKTPIIFVLDMSISMRGDKRALLLAAVAALAMRLPPNRRAILAFDSSSHWIEPLDRESTLEDLLMSLLGYTVSGFTNLHQALELLIKELNTRQLRSSQIVFFSDGRSTEGRNPIELAHHFRTLHTVKIGKDFHGAQVLEAMAHKTRGMAIELRSTDELVPGLAKLARLLSKK